MESSGQVTKTEEMMINGKGNDASRTCSRWDKRIGEGRQWSVSIAGSSCERDLRRSSCHLDAILCRNTINQAVTSLWKIKKLIGGETVAKSSHGLVAEYVTQMEKLWRF